MDDRQSPPEDFEIKGVLRSACSRAVLKCLHVTRVARPELRRAVNSLAREATRWTIISDKRLHRLLSFVHYNRDPASKSWIGNIACERNLRMPCDGSFTGDLKDHESTSGSLLCSVGLHTFCPITQLYKQQFAISHSSTEAEKIALDMGLPLDGLPAMGLRDLMFNVPEPQTKEQIETATSKISIRVKKFSLLLVGTRELLPADYVPPNARQLSERCKLMLMEDDDAVSRMCVKVRAPTMRHVLRAHRVDVDTLLERNHADWESVFNVSTRSCRLPTSLQKAASQSRHGILCAG